MNRLRLPALALLAGAATGCWAGAPVPPQYHWQDGLPTYQYSGPFGRYAPMAPLGMILYRNAKGASAWQSHSLRDVEAMGPIAERKPVKGEACQWSINLQLFLLPIYVNLDDSSYQAAYLQALRSGGGVDALVDVRADRSVMSVLSIYWRVCTQLNATGVTFANGSSHRLGPSTASR